MEHLKLGAVRFDVKASKTLITTKLKYLRFDVLGMYSSSKQYTWSKAAV